MAKAKYTKGKDGYYATRLWDGTYNPNGIEHRINLRTRKNSGALEKMILDVYNHIILGKENAVSAVESAMNF